MCRVFKPCCPCCVTDGRNADARLEIQGVVSRPLDELAAVHESTLLELFC